MNAKPKTRSKAPTFPFTVDVNGVLAKIYRYRTAAGYTEHKVIWHEGPRRKMRAFADFTEAETFAREACNLVSTGDHATIALTGDDRLVYQRALDFLAPCGTPLDLAAERYAMAAAKLGKTPLMDAVEEYVRRHPSSMESKTVREVLDQMLKAKRADKLSDVYLRDLEMRAGQFADDFACSIGSVDAPRLNEWLRSLDCGGRTRNNFRAVIATLFKYAESEGLVPKDQIDFDRVAKAREDQSEIEIFTPGELGALLQAARLNPEDLEPGYNRRYATAQGLLPLLVLGAFAGLRTAEVQRQRWSDINLQQGFIRVSAVKGNTAQKRLVPISENLKAWLAVCNPQAETCCDYPRTWEALARLAERAGVTWKHNALRHSYITYRVAQTNDVPRVALEAGNSTAMIFRHYRQLTTGAVANDWFSIMPAL